MRSIWFRMFQIWMKRFSCIGVSPIPISLIWRAFSFPFPIISWCFIGIISWIIRRIGRLIISISVITLSFFFFIRFISNFIIFFCRSSSTTCNIINVIKKIFSNYISKQCNISYSYNRRKYCHSYSHSRLICHLVCYI